MTHEAETVVRAAIDLGVNFIDTAESYGTEAIVGQAIAGLPRDSVVLSTKAGVDWQEHRSTPEQMRQRIDDCLCRLGTDFVDVFHLHGVSVEEYEYARSALVPTLLDLKAEGKIRALGITEAFISDPGHRMLQMALQDDCWEVVMVGFNLINQSARGRVFPITAKKGIGTLCMFAVRRALSQPEALRQLIGSLRDAGKIDTPSDEVLGFLTEVGVALSLQEAAYRYCRWEPGIDVVLSGTGSEDHLRDNARSLVMPDLPPKVRTRLAHLFAGIDTVSGN